MCARILVISQSYKPSFLCLWQANLKLLTKLLVLHFHFEGNTLELTLMIDLL